MAPLAEFFIDPSPDINIEKFLKPTHGHNKRSRKLRSSVRFVESPEVRSITSRKDFSDQEVESIWYTGREYYYIKKVNNATVKMMSRGRELNPEVHCIRGLECRTEDGQENKSRNKMMARNAVLQEQEYQKLERICEPALFAQVSRVASHCARKDARERGLQDERDAFDLEGPFATTRINTTDETPLEEDVFDDINLGFPVYQELEGGLMDSIGASYFSF